MEYLAENARLRQLSRRYSEGLLSAGDYRAARREILEALEAGRTQTDYEEADEPVVETPVQATDFADATGVREPEDAAVFLKTMPPSSGPIAAPAPPPAIGWDGHTRVLAAVLGISLLLALGALVYVFAL